MIDWLVFSKDRPLQLDCLLESFDQHAPDLQRTVTVLYTCSSPLYQLGYLDCAKTHRRHTFWRQSESFAADVREWIAGQGYYIGFLVDDDLFVRGAPPVETVRPRAGEACFSLRLRYPSRSWRWDLHAELDYSYPLALDGHVYRRETITALLGFDFRDPTQLEAGLASVADQLPDRLMAANPSQCLVGIPANRVSESSGMPHMGGDVSKLLELYLAGWRVDRQAMGLKQVETAHAEIALQFRKVASTVPT